MTPTPAPLLSVRLSIMMFLQFFVWGSWYVSMTGWMAKAGIGGLGAWAYTVCPIAAIISPFIVGVIADRFFATQRVLAVLHVLGGAVFLALPSVVANANAAVPTPETAYFSHPFVLMTLAHALCYMPTLALTNSLCFAHMSNPSRQFPPVRTLGTIGWIIGNIVVGGTLSLGSMKFTWIADGAASVMQWYIAGAAAVALGVFCLTLPNTPPPAKGKQIRVSELLGLDSLQLLAKPAYLVFAICSFLLCIPLAGYYSNAFNFVSGVMPDNAMVTMSSGQMSEIVFMLLMPLMFARLGVKWMLAVGMLAWVARYGLFSAAATDKVMWMTAIGVALHGICYDFFFVTGFIYVDKTAPKEIKGQAQGFLVLITQGLGLGLGAQLFGMLVGHYTPAGGGSPDWKMIWAVPAAFALVVLIFFVAAFREKKEAA
ncbi:MAG: MFS transporter [Planctomycetota bacterium]|nr:MFS transporter [Planctomycetota bacterium]